jgi:ribosomal protein S1
MPFGRKHLPDGEERNFDELYVDVLKPELEELDLAVTRADDIFGPPGIIDVVWRGIQEAEVVVAVMTGRFPNVALELGLALLLGKRIVMVTERPEDIPSDLQGLRYITYTYDGPSLLKMARTLKETIEAIRSEPVDEMMTVPMPGTGTASVKATVISVVKDAVTVQADGGRRAVMGPADVDWSKILTDMTRRFSVGQELNGAFEMDLSGNQRYSLIANEPNPWPDLARSCSPGAVMTGQVRNVADNLGVFVEVAPGISGLIPHYTVPAHVQLQRGAMVGVRVEKFDAIQRRIDLRLVGEPRRTDASHPNGNDAAISVSTGAHLEGEVVKAAAERGYILLTAEELPGPALLHVSRMSEELRDDLLAGKVEVGEIIDVELVEIDAMRNRFLVADLPLGDEEDEVALPQAS